MPSTPKPLAGEIGFADAEGATAPETLRQKNRKGMNSLERGAVAPADGITLSGIRTEGAPVSRSGGPDKGASHARKIVSGDLPALAIG